MHKSNRKAWAYFKNKHPNYFEGDISVLEVGSFNVNGSVREYFKSTKYIGIDWRAGPGVDQVCFAHEMNFPEKFDTVISASMLEHDPYWDKSLPAIVAQMKANGLLLLGWGAAKNSPHGNKTACDGKFHALKAGLVLDALKNLGVYIHEFRYERNVPGVLPEDCLKSGGIGEVVLSAFKDKSLATEEGHIDPLLPEDR